MECECDGTGTNLVPIVVCAVLICNIHIPGLWQQKPLKHSYSHRKLLPLTNGCEKKACEHDFRNTVQMFFNAHVLVSKLVMYKAYLRPDLCCHTVIFSISSSMPFIDQCD